MMTIATTDTIMAPIFDPVLLCTEIVFVICVNATPHRMNAKNKMLNSQ